MTDIITRVEQVIIDHTSDDVSYGELAQALADAGLLAEPARTVPTRDEIVDVILDTHLFDGGTPIDTADAILKLLADQPTVDDVRLEAIAEERLRNDSGVRIPLEELQIRDGK